MTEMLRIRVETVYEHPAPMYRFEYTLPDREVVKVDTRDYRYGLALMKEKIEAYRPTTVEYVDLEVLVPPVYGKVPR